MIEALNEMIKNVKELNTALEETGKTLTRDELNSAISLVQEEIKKDLKKAVLQIEQVLDGTSDLPKTQQEIMKLKLEESTTMPIGEKEKLILNFMRLCKASDEDSGYNFLVPMAKEIIEIIINLTKKIQPELLFNLEEILRKVKEY